MADRLRIVVGGLLGQVPNAGGVAWDYVQYPAGFAAAGHDVYYIEDTRLWPLFPAEAEPYCSINVAHLRSVMAHFGMDDRWAYRDEDSGSCFGLPLERVLDICRTADVFVNISCSTYMREEYRAIPARVLIDSDPMFTQIQLETLEMFTEGEPALRELVDAHNYHFTFGENYGKEDCRIPACGIAWRPTRQPILLDAWQPSPMPEDGAYTTVMNWSAAKDLEYEGERWGQKNEELLRFRDLPAAVAPVALAIAVGSTRKTPFPLDDFERRGWEVLDPVELLPDLGTYRDFIAASRGEFGVAKGTYIKGNTGWFSCRSACYLAMGRPVVTQDTGWSRYYPHEEGLLSFRTPKEAAEAIRRIEAEPLAHGIAAREIAEEYFDCRKVLGDLLEQVGG